MISSRVQGTFHGKLESVSPVPCPVLPLRALPGHTLAMTRLGREKSLRKAEGDMDRPTDWLSRHCQQRGAGLSFQLPSFDVYLPV